MGNAEREARVRARNHCNRSLEFVRLFTCNGLHNNYVKDIFHSAIALALAFLPVFGIMLRAINFFPSPLSPSVLREEYHYPRHLLFSASGGDGTCFLPLEPTSFFGQFSSMVKSNFSPLDGPARRLTRGERTSPLRIFSPFHAILGLASSNVRFINTFV